MRRCLALAAAFATFVGAPDAKALVWPDVPQKIERDLASGDASTRRVAARKLRSVGRGRGEKLVLKALADSDIEVRIAAAESAIKLRVERATLAVLPWLGDRDARLRAMSCEVARAMPDPRAVPDLARALGDANADVRASAANALGAQSSRDAVAPLLGRLDDNVAHVRVQIARALARLGDKRSVVPLVGKIRDGIPEVRVAVAVALGDLGDERAAHALAQALRDHVSEVRTAAVDALGKLGNEDTVDAIAHLMSDSDPRVRSAAARALGRIRTEAAIRALVGHLGDVSDARRVGGHSPTRDALVGIGPPATAAVANVLARHPTPRTAAAATWVLGEIGTKQAVDAIAAAIQQGRVDVAAALEALGRARQPSATRVVLEHVSDADARVRRAALHAAGELLDPAHPDGRALEPLLVAMDRAREHPEELASVARLVGKTGAARAGTKLIPLLDAKSMSVRIAAIDALSDIQGHGADEALVKLLGDPSPLPRSHAARALARSGSAHARDLLIEAIEGKRPVDRAALLSALGGVLERHPSERVAILLTRLLELSAGPERDALITAIGRGKTRAGLTTLAAMAQSSDPDDRRAAAAMLAAWGPDARAIGASLLRDADARVRARAAWAAWSFGDATEVARLTKSSDADVAINATAALGRLPATGAVRDGAVSALCARTSDPRAYVRANAFGALANLKARCPGGQFARKHLLQDGHELVRLAAARAIARQRLDADARALVRCRDGDRFASVARVCAEGWSPPEGSRPVDVYAVGPGATTPTPSLPVTLELASGLVLCTTTDRRGAVFESSAPTGTVRLRPPSAQAR